MVRQQENFRALMNNWSEVERLTGVAADSTGSATERMGTFLDGIEAKTNQLKTAWEAFVTGLNQSESYKEFLDFCIWTLDNIPVMIGYLVSLVALFKGKTIISKIADITASTGGLFKNIGLAGKAFIVAKQSGHSFSATLRTMAGAEQAAAVSAQLLNIALMAVVAAITVGVQAYTSWKQAQYEAGQAAREEADKYEQKALAMEEAIIKYKEIYNSSNDYSVKQTELKSLSEELTTQYGEEAKALDLLNGSYESNIAVMERKANEDRKKKLAELQVSAQAGAENLDNTMNRWAGNAEYKLSNKEYFSKEGNENVIKDLNNILSGKNAKNLTPRNN